MQSPKQILMCVENWGDDESTPLCCWCDYCPHLDHTCLNAVGDAVQRAGNEGLRAKHGARDAEEGRVRRVGVHLGAPVPLKQVGVGLGARLGVDVRQVFELETVSARASRVECVRGGRCR
jgi:hypothetical protein